MRERNRQVGDGVLAAVNDPKAPRPIPAIEDVPPALNFAPIENAAGALTRAADRYKAAAAKYAVSGAAVNGTDGAGGRLGLDSSVLRTVNARLMQSERQLVDDGGLPRRPWYRHLLYAPGFYTGYGVKTMPGVREGIEDKRYAEAEREAARVAAAIEREARLIDEAAAVLEKGPGTAR